MTVNFIYPAFVLGMGDGSLGDLASLDFAVQAVDDTATPLQTDSVLDDLTGLLGDPVALSGIAWGVTSFVDGGGTTRYRVDLTCDDSALEIDTLVEDDAVQALVVFVDTGTPSTSTLAGWYGRRADTSPVAGVSTGAPAPITWPTDGCFIRFPL